MCPDMTRKIYKNDLGWNYHTDGKTAWVEVGITMNGQEHIDNMAIMDAKNNSLPIERVTSFDVNKAIQRSTTKAIALHGLGLYIYAGEDMTAEEKAAKAPSEPTIIELVVGDENWAKVMNYLTANKKKGSKFIIEQLSKKYSISEATRSEINKEVAS
jgi:hypothetical protein